jgi:hypothetical protein
MYIYGERERCEGREKDEKMCISKANRCRDDEEEEEKKKNRS